MVTFIRLIQMIPTMLLIWGVLNLGDGSLEGITSAIKKEDFTYYLFALFVLFLWIYPMPTIAAFKNNHPSRWVILVFNFFGGLTGLGWLLCLIWAHRETGISEIDNQHRQPRREYSSRPQYQEPKRGGANAIVTVGLILLVMGIGYASLDNFDIKNTPNPIKMLQNGSKVKDTIPYSAASITPSLTSPQNRLVASLPRATVVGPCQQIMVEDRHQIESCINYELKREDSRLNANYRALTNSFNEKEETKLRDIQRRWISLRDERCLSQDSIASAECLWQMTVERADELANLDPKFF